MMLQSIGTVAEHLAKVNHVLLALNNTLMTFSWTESGECIFIVVSKMRHR
jgi:hypothetical protein